ncbi:MAG: LLM class F420-dependent oxidoreductase [Anaerolineales bacterium]|nr:LLM class F420-dependent oxidoreductase [Anaerolineae bacterium]PWB55824.1 MAG: LLM class F420-dependent oxidoreductase [Anaerolineales bacterium]
MKIGVVFPQTEFPPDPLAVRDYAQAVEGLGYSHMHAYDHVLGANPERPGGWTGPYTFKHAFFEPFVLFSFLAGLTQRIEFATGILILPQRQTALVAKQAATLDVLSQGRLRLGVGNGWNEVEYITLGEDFHTRGRRMEEQVELLRLLWTQPLVKFEGRFDNIPDAGLNPLPVQRPIPIWFGGTDDKVIQRMARMGDGWMLNIRSLEQARPALDKLANYLEEASRDKTSFGIDLRLNLSLVGLEAWQDFTHTCEELGASHLTVNTMGMGNDTPLKHLSALQSFATAIGLTT